jgi:hypothetical protein
VFGFIPESVFAFIPEPRSESSRNAVRFHPGIAFAFARNPHSGPLSQRKLAGTPRSAITRSSVRVT